MRLIMLENDFGLFVLSLNSQSDFCPSFTSLQQECSFDAVTYENIVNCMSLDVSDTIDAEDI